MSLSFSSFGRTQQVSQLGFLLLPKHSSACVMLHNCFWLKSSQLTPGQTLHTFPHVQRDWNSQTRSVWLSPVPGCKPETGFEGANGKAKARLVRQGHSVILGEIQSQVTSAIALPVPAMRFKVRITKCGLSSTWGEFRRAMQLGYEHWGGFKKVP